MTKFNPRNPAALRAAFEGDWKNAVVASTPGGIEAQEAAAQRELQQMSKLPKDGTIHGRYGRDAKNANRVNMEQWGFVFGEEIDDLFVAATLPQGWSICLSGHSMWSHIIDAQGRERMSIFYKGAFYDRSAHLTVTSRYRIATWYAATPELPELPREATYEERSASLCCHVVKDCDGTVLHATAAHQYRDYKASDKANEACRQWLATHYPDWQNPFAYWEA